MNYRIIGNKKSNDTKKLIRYFKERNIAFQFVDIQAGDLKTGELNRVFSHLDADDLIDENSKAYEKKGLKYMDYDAEEEISENLDLLKNPILRIGDRFYLCPSDSELKNLVKKD